MINILELSDNVCTLKRYVNPWLIHVNVWQKPLQYCKVISLQLIKINGEKKKVFIRAYYLGFPGGTSGEERPCQCRRLNRQILDPWIRKIPWRKKWQPTPVFLPGESHGHRSLTGYSPWGRRVRRDYRDLAYTYTLIGRVPTLCKNSRSFPLRIY